MADYAGPDRRQPVCEAPRSDSCMHGTALAAQAADLAVKDVFAILGVDVSKPEQVEEFRKDLRFGQTMRKAADKGFLTMVAVIFGGIVYALWAGINIKMGVR